MTAPARAPKPRIVYPRPPIVQDHSVLFREATYEDGQSYAEPEDEEEGPA